MSTQSVCGSRIYPVQFINKNNIIPENAKDYKNEYLFIRGIDKSCENFINKYVENINDEVPLFESPQAKKIIYFFNKFLKAQEFGYLKDISEFYLKDSDVKYVKYLENEIDCYMDLFIDPVSYEFDEEKYEGENIDPGLKEFYESFTKFNDKI